MNGVELVVSEKKIIYIGIGRVEGIFSRVSINRS